MLVVYVGGAAFALVSILIAILALFELYNLTAAYRPLRWAGYLGTIITAVAAWLGDHPERDGDPRARACQGCWRRSRA